jgi:hypothetical protein
MGQLLCIAMILASGLLAIFLRHDRPNETA